MNSINKGLMESAFRFLKKAIIEFEEDHEVSLVNFAVFLELFLKYRLIQEHWSLIIKNNQNTPPDVKKYLQGDFRSIEASCLVNTIEHATEDCFTKEEKDLYTAVIRHRNQIVHFYSMDSSDEQPVIAGLIVKGWAQVIYRIEHHWKEYFTSFDSVIQSIIKDFEKFKPYFKERYKVLKPHIEEIISGGTTVLQCKYCEQESLIANYETNAGVIYFKCGVCGAQETLLKSICSKCHQTNYSNYKNDHCNQCSNVLFETAPNDYVAHKEGYAHDWRCSSCGSSEVIEQNGKYICLNCDNISEDTYQCEWCNEIVMGDSREDTYYNGCDLCDGASGHMKDD